MLHGVSNGLDISGQVPSSYERVSCVLAVDRGITQLVAGKDYAPLCMSVSFDATTTILHLPTSL